MKAMKLSQYLLSAVSVMTLSCTTPKTNPCETKDLKSFSNLEKFIENLPKGAELHSHLQGASSPESLLEMTKNDKLYYDPKTQTVLEKKKEGSLLLSEAVKKSKLKKELIQAWTIEGYEGDKSHDHFFQTFKKVKAITSTESKYIDPILLDLIQKTEKQKVPYLELIVNPINKELRKMRKLVERADLKDEKSFNKLYESLIKANFLKHVSELRKEVDHTEKFLTEKLGYNPFLFDAPVLLRFIYQASRNESRGLVFSRLMIAFHLASLDERFVGVNLVTPEDGDVAIKDYDIHMNMLHFLGRLYPKVGITLHAGELTTHLADPKRTLHNIRKAIEVGGASRIGHGVALKQDPQWKELLQEMSAKHILVEINLSSNAFILGVKGKEHPLRTYMEHGVPVALCTDDEGVLRTNMSQEYLRAVREQNLNYQELKQAIRDSIQYSFLKEKTQMLSKVERNLREFEGEYCSK